MKRFFIIVLTLLLVFALPSTVNAENTEEIVPFDVNAKSAVLMDAETGRILYAKNSNEALPPASVTKVMTLLLIMEHIDSKKMSLADDVTVSEYAASMGGSQVFLEAGESLSCEDMLKSIIISSANDAAVAMAEAVCGTEEAFVKRMNERAKELNMTNTNFENVTGLDDDTNNHLISAMDIAIASRELITKHPTILNYSCIWMDSIRNGEFGLTNTNRLIRFYKGATGLKTGSTDKAGFCISATAKREELHLIAVIMGSETRDIRNEAAKALLDYGFSNFAIYKSENLQKERLNVLKGDKKSFEIEMIPFSCLLEKNYRDSVEIKTEYKDIIKAPVKKGDIVGEATFLINGKSIGRTPMISCENVGMLGFFDVFLMMIRSFFLT